MNEYIRFTLELGKRCGAICRSGGCNFGGERRGDDKPDGTGARAINAALDPRSSPLRQVGKNFDLLTGGVPAEVAPEIALEGVQSSLQRGLPVRQSVVNRPAHEVGRASPLERASDSWAFQNDTMMLRQRRPSR